jgi:hypothetical protein
MRFLGALLNGLVCFFSPEWQKSKLWDEGIRGQGIFTICCPSPPSPSSGDFDFELSMIEMCLTVDYYTYHGPSGIK